MLTDYTTYNDIRAALGVSDEDLEDETLALSLYSGALTQELEDISVTLPDTYAAKKAVTSPTALEVRFLTACSLFATYSVAKMLTAALPLFAAKQVGDGKAVVQRFDNPYRETIKSVNNQYDQMRNRLVVALGAVGSGSAPTVSKAYFGVISPDVDPVTGA